MVELTLNQTGSEVLYHQYFGRPSKRLFGIYQDGMMPLTAAGLMQRRLDVKDVFLELAQVWWGNTFYTGTPVLYHPDGKVKFTHDTRPLQEVTPGSKIINQAIVLPDGMYEDIEGFELTEKWVEKINNTHLTRKDARYDPVWRFLAGNDYLLEQYADAVFDIAKAVFNSALNMGIFLNDLPEKVPTMRLVTIAGINQRSIAAGATYVDNPNSVLVGVTPDTLEHLVPGTIDSNVLWTPESASQGTLEERVRQTTGVPAAVEREFPDLV